MTKSTTLRSLFSLSLSLSLTSALGAAAACGDDAASQADPTTSDASSNAAADASASGDGGSGAPTPSDASAPLADASADVKTTPPTPWPEWAFSHWIWEGESTQQSAIDILDGYAAHGIPVGAIMIDSPWETGYNTLEWDKGLFPDPKKLIDDIHARNARVLLWIVPAVNTDVAPLYEDMKSQSYFMTQLPFGSPAVVSWWKGKGSLLDYLSAPAVAFWEKKLDLALAYGIDGWKCDGIDVSVTSAPFSHGKSGLVTHKAYADAYYRHFYEYTRKKLGSDRLITARPVDTYGYDVGLLGQTGIDEATFAPRDINVVGWVGDQDATFDGMKAALLNMYYSAAQGFVGFGSDIGGYRTDDAHPPQMRSKELFVRWAQLGAFSPLMENGGGGEHRPWMFDTETTDIYRTFVKLHYALIPYFMEHGWSAYQAKKSMVTFLDKADFRYLLGPDVFVAPMLDATPSRTLTFPPGGDTWVYLFDKSKTYAGGATVTLSVPLGEFPVFVKKGSAVEGQLVVTP
ncbi:MAG: glycoside hydrolase family 31 protein [Polyangiaceae bacterium]